MIVHGSEGATALIGLAGFVVGAHVLEDGEWWLLVETTADRSAVRRVGCGRSGTAVAVCRSVICRRGAAGASGVGEAVWRCPDRDCATVTWSETSDRSHRGRR